MRLRQARKIYKRVYRSDKSRCPYKISTMREAERTLERAWRRYRTVSVDERGRRWFSVTTEHRDAARLMGFWRPYRALRKILRARGEWRDYRRGIKPWERDEQAD